MANHKSAIKRNRQNIKRRERNRQARSKVRTAIRLALDTAKSGKKDEAQKLVKQAEIIAAKAASKGLIHWKNAARRISRLSAQVTR